MTQMQIIQGSAAPRGETRATGLGLSAGVAACLGVIALAVIWHISVGAKPIAFATVRAALTSPDPDLFDHVVVRELRLPRAVFALSVGAALSVAGALMQGVTRNPLAEPSILGLMAGASFAVILGIGWFGLADTGFIPLFAALGAVMGALLVWAIATAATGGGGSATPLMLVLSGAAVTGFLSAVESIAILVEENTFRDFRLWLSGSLSGRDMAAYMVALPWFLGGLALALALARQVTTLSMGEETAAGLGVNVTRLRLLVLTAVVALTAAAVSVAGPMGFVGLVIPHVTRLCFGADYRRIIPFSALFGAGYLVIVDTAARSLLAPAEISTGLMTTILGAPLFIWLVRARL